MRCLNLTVVICSHFSIFETLETTRALIVAQETML